MRVRLCVVAVLAASATLLAGSTSSAGAAEAPTGGVRSITVTDPAGDVSDVRDARTVREGRSVDITRADYRVERVPSFGHGFLRTHGAMRTHGSMRTHGPGKRAEQVTFEVQNRRILGGFERFCERQLLTVTFTSGPRQYRATAGSRFDLVSRVGSGPWEPAGTSYSSGCSGGPRANESSFEFSVPASTFAAGEISDIRTTLRVKGSRARDVVDVPTETLTFDPRR